MITKATGFQTSDGSFHATFADARTHELFLLVSTNEQDTKTAIAIRDFVTAHGDKLIDILTATPQEPRRKYTRKAKETQT